MFAFFSAFDWQHSVLLGGAIIGGILVGVGILMESEKWSLAAILVLIGIAMEPLFTIGLFLYDESLGRSQQSTIEAQNKEIISLQKRLLPRSFPPDAQLRAAEKVCPLGPKPFDALLASGSDTLFMGQVENVWKKCGWMPVGMKDRDEVIGAIGNSTGVRLLYDQGNAELKEVATAFAAALVAEGIAATAEQSPTGTKLNPAVIHIIFARRP
jgi:hypothetical protein